MNACSTISRRTKIKRETFYILSCVCGFFFVRSNIRSITFCFRCHVESVWLTRWLGFSRESDIFSSYNENWFTRVNVLSRPSQSIAHSPSQSVERNSIEIAKKNKREGKNRIQKILSINWPVTCQTKEWGSVDFIEHFAYRNVEISLYIKRMKMTKLLTLVDTIFTQTITVNGWKTVWKCDVESSQWNGSDKAKKGEKC